MPRSAGFRFFVVGMLILLMFIPLFFVGAVIESRAEYSRETIRNVSQDWGGAQRIAGPQLIIPVEGPVIRQERRETVDPRTGERLFELVDVTETGRRAPVYVLPDRFDVTLETRTEERSRGIFRVPVYTAETEMRFDLPVAGLDDHLEPEERLLWNEAELVIGLSDNRALRGAATLSAGTRDLPLEPWAGPDAGIAAAVGDPRDLGELTLQLGFNGAQYLTLAPMGRTTEVRMASDWPHPSFTGAFLPDASEITDAGFEARWTIPHLARNLPQVSRQDPLTQAVTDAFGVRFFQPNDFYQKAYRAARYGILFIALTFLTVLLIEDRQARPAHPVQYILIGLAQSVFLLLMVAYAEQIGFGAAYTLAAVATVALLTLYGAAALKLGRRTLILGGMLAALYAVIYVILRSEDYALVAGSTLAFAALAGTMFATRKEDWSGPGRTPGDKPRGWFAGRRRVVPPSDSPPAMSETS